MMVSENQMMNSSPGSSKGSGERMSESVMKESTTINAKLKKLANAKKEKKQRTEHLSAYSMFLKEEKQAAGSKPLNMILVNQSWRRMTQIEKEPYIKLSNADKESLGPNYRLGRRKSTPKLKSEKKLKIKAKPKTLKKVKLNVNPGPSLSQMLNELKSIDDDITEKTAMKAKLLKEIADLEFRTESKVKEMDDLDSLVNNFNMKCNVLKSSKKSTS